VLEKLVDAGIENVMVLRGDPPAGQTRFQRTEGGFSYAADLVRYIRKRFGRTLCLGGAGNPEGHIETRDLDQDIKHLKAKVDAGLDFVVTQLFFDNRVYFDFVKRARVAGIGVPIVPGLMPIRTVAGIERMTGLSGASIPRRCTPSWNDAATTTPPSRRWASRRRPRRRSNCFTAARRGSTSTR
jgi:methylenetetrahydrofolate reductase (NADPH)